MLWVTAALSLSQVQAQTGSRNAPKEPADAGAIVVPPSVGDRQAIEKAPAPAAVDPGMVERPPAGRNDAPSRARPAAPSAPGSGSKDSSCTGPVELCRQSTPR